MRELYICEKAEACTKGRCEHRGGHERREDCDAMKCHAVGDQSVKCILVKTEEILKVTSAQYTFLTNRGKLFSVRAILSDMVPDQYSQRRSEILYLVDQSIREMNNDFEEI